MRSTRSVPPCIVIPVLIYPDPGAAADWLSKAFAQSPRPPMPRSTLQETPRDVPSKTRVQDGFATSFPVGLLHPLQHAGLSRRSPSSPSIANLTKTLPRFPYQYSHLHLVP